jgi:hypothetical protein
MEDPMLDQLEKLQIDLSGFREAVDRIFSPTLITPESWQACFQEILISASKLYLDYLLVMKNLSAMEIASSKSSSTGHLRVDTLRERNLRERLKHELQSSHSWNHFRPQNPFSGLTGLHTTQDYTDRLTLHLPEIYEETFRVEAYTKTFLANHDGPTLARLAVGLQHLGRNHIAFVLQPLEWVADEGSWDESLVGARDS